MNRKWLHLVSAAGLIGLAACKESTAPSLYNDATVTADVAASAGDAISTSVETMTGNEGTAALPSPGISFDLFGTKVMSVIRTRTCYDSTGTVVAACTPIASVRKIVTHVTLDGTRSGTTSTTGGATSSYTGAVHRVIDDTVKRVFSAGVETSRVHGALGTSHDTTSFSNGTVTRDHNEVATDSTVAVTWTLPRTTNPYPTSGKIIRNVALHTTFTSSTQTVTRDVTRRVEVDFNGTANVTLTINAKTCSLNLATHVVSNCQ
jgi:hypothetical protein